MATFLSFSGLAIAALNTAGKGLESDSTRTVAGMSTVRERACGSVEYTTSVRPRGSAIFYMIYMSLSLYIYTRTHLCIQLSAGMVKHINI